MLKIKLTEASRFSNALLTQKIQIPIKKKKILIGRGQDLLQLQNKSLGVIDLTSFDNTLSRIHTCFCFSPSWFKRQQQYTPKYLHSLGKRNLPEDVANKIWEFIKPKKVCLLKDEKSKLGIFKQLESEYLQPASIVQFVHQSFIAFQTCLQFNTIQELSQYLTDSVQQDRNLVVLGDVLRTNKLKHLNFYKNSQILKVWKFSVKQQNYLLLAQNNLVLRIGRSSHCQIQIKDTAISRYQAYLKCENYKWKIYDGNQIYRSKNGTWKKCKLIQIPISKNQTQIKKCFIKIGTIKCQIELIEKFSWISLSKIFNQQKSQSFIKIGMQQNEQQIEKKLNKSHSSKSSNGKEQVFDDFSLSNKSILLSQSVHIFGRADQSISQLIFDQNL